MIASNYEATFMLCPVHFSDKNTLFSKRDQLNNIRHWIDYSAKKSWYDNKLALMTPITSDCLVSALASPAQIIFILYSHSNRCHSWIFLPVSLHDREVLHDFAKITNWLRNFCFLFKHWTAIQTYVFQSIITIFILKTHRVIVNRLWPCDTIWRHKSGSTLVQEMRGTTWYRYCSNYIYIYMCVCVCVRVCVCPGAGVHQVHHPYIRILFGLRTRALPCRWQ